MEIDDADVATNSAKVAALADELDGQTLDLVILPELCDYGYDLASIRKRMDSAESPVLDAMRSLATRLECHVAGGIVELEDDRLYDTLTVVGPAGEIESRYRKIQLFAPGGEAEVFEPGRSLETMRIREWRVGLAICNDLRYPEIARGLTAKDIDVLVLSAAWPFPRVRHFTLLVEARAIENQIFVIAANRLGRFEDTVFCGSSRIIDPHGDIVSSASEDKETFMRARLHRGVLDWVRQRPGWKTRRLEFD